MEGSAEDDLRKGRPLEQVLRELETSEEMQNAQRLVEILKAEEYNYERDLKFLDDEAIQTIRKDHGLSVKAAAILRKLRRDAELRSSQLSQTNDHVSNVTFEQPTMDNSSSYFCSGASSAGNFQSPDDSSGSLAAAAVERQFPPSPGFVLGNMPSAQSSQASFTWHQEQHQQQQQQSYLQQQFWQEQPATSTGHYVVTDNMGPPTFDLLDDPIIVAPDFELTNDLNGNGNERRISAYFNSPLPILEPPPWRQRPAAGIYRCDFGNLGPSQGSSRVYSWRKNGGTRGASFSSHSVEYTCTHYHGKIVKSKRASKRSPYGSGSEESEDQAANYAVGTLIKTSTSQIVGGVMEISYRAETAPSTRGSKRKESESESDSDRFKKPKSESWLMPPTGAQTVQMSLLPEEYMRTASSMPTVKVKQEPVQQTGLIRIMKQLETVSLTPPSSTSTATSSLSELKKKPILIGQVLPPTSSSVSSIASTVPMDIAESSSVAASDMTRRHEPSVLTRHMNPQLNRQVDRPSQFIDSPYIRPRGEHAKCTACTVLLQGAQAVAEHKISLGHKLKVNPESVTDSIQHTTFDCVLCSTRISGMDQVKQHLEGAKHKKKVMLEGTLQAAPRDNY